MANLINESSRMIVLGVLALGLVGGLFLLLNPTGGGSDMTTTATKEPVADTTIPPLDAAAPTEVETATFALG